MDDSREQLETELLALRASQGDSAALDELLRRWQKPLWRYLRGLCGNDEWAWDLLQDTCLSLAKAIRRLKRSEAFRALAFQIAYRRYVDFVRRDQRQRVVSDAIATTQRISEESHGDDHQQLLLQEAVAALPEQERSMISLVYLEGFSYDEIAKLMDLPVGTVKSRVYYAKTKLRRVINQGE